MGFHLIEGSSGDDTLLGTSSYDLIFAFDGDDSIDAGSGNAAITAGPGSDTIDYTNVQNGFANLFHRDLTAGIDAVLNIDDDIATISSSGDVDTILGIQGLFEKADTTDGIYVDGTQYADSFYIKHTVYSDGQLIIRPGDGVDSFYVDGLPGQLSNTRLIFDGGPEGAIIDLSLETDQIINDGYGNTETISGPAYIRQFFLTVHDDHFVGGDGDERIVGFSGNDYIDGGAGVDRIDFTGGGGYSSVVVNLQDGWATGSFSYFDPNIGEAVIRDLNYTLVNIENVSGAGGSSDNITGSNANNLLRGRGGDDTITGLGGDDTLRGDGGDDYLNGGMGNDTLIGGTGADHFIFNLQNGHDVVDDFEQGIDRLDLGEFGDFLLFGGQKVVALDLPDDVVTKLLDTTKIVTGFDILDSNLDGVLNGNDEAIEMVNDGGDLLIDLGAAFEGNLGTDTVLVLGITELKIDDFIF